jgi:L-glyceraldehyde 3-phosphate reductase
MEEDAITDDSIRKVQKLNKLADERGQSLAQMALAWVLKDPRITSVILGASRPDQITDALRCLNNYHFSADELHRIESILSDDSPASVRKGRCC